MDIFDQENNVIQRMLWEGEVPSNPQSLSDEGKVVFIHQFIIDEGVLSKVEIDSLNRVDLGSPIPGDSERLSLIIERELKEKRFSLIHEDGWEYGSSNSFLELEEVRSSIGEDLSPEEFQIVEN